MEDFGAPSFSLGLDLDFDSEPQENPREESVAEQVAPISVSSESFEEEGDFRSEIVDRDVQCEEQPRVFKRLRRGIQTQSSCTRKKDSVSLTSNVDEEIEEFSSQEDTFRDESSFKQKHSVCSSSKFPVHGQKVLTRQSVSKPNGSKPTPVSAASISIDLEASEKKLMFPKLTVSPIRRFQLLDSDSDSDDTPIAQNRYHDVEEIGPSEKERKSKPSQSLLGDQQMRSKLSASMPQSEDLWKNFIPKETVSIPTPALDNFCEEYFRSAKDENVLQSNADTLNLSTSRSNENSANENAEFPPAYQYFYHDDPRIQRLVRDRLPNFVPLGVVDKKGNPQSDTVAIDYMRQFGHGESSTQLYCKAKVNMGIEESLKGGKKNVKNSSSKEVSQVSKNWLDPSVCMNKVRERRAKRGRKNVKSSCTKEVSQASKSWMNPKSCDSNPKDAGKRRVHADGRSTGHWYTGEDGRKVYVTKNGQELTGQIAYRHYRKESGAGFKRSRKKTTSKKKSGQ